MGKNKNGIKNDCYFKEFFQHGYFLVSVLISTLAVTLLVLNFKYDVTTAIDSVKNLGLYVGIGIGIFALFVVIYMFGKTRCARLSMADSIGFSLILSGIGSALVLIFSEKRFDQKGINNIIIAGIVFVLGIAYLLFRLAFFKAHERRRIIYIKNSLSGYFSLIGQKYSFMSVLLTALVACSVMHLAFNSSFANLISLSFRHDKPFLAIMIGMAVLFLLYIVIEVSNKHVSPVDLLLSSGVIFFPVSALNCILLKKNYINNLTVLAIAFAFYLLIFIVRILCFDITVPEKHGKKRFSDVILSVTVSALLVGGASLLIQTNAIKETIPAIGKVGSIHCITALPVIIIALAIALATIFNLVISIVNINSKKISGSDVLADVSFISSIMAFAILSIYPSTMLALILGALFLVNLAVFIARQRVLHSKK